MDQPTKQHTATYPVSSASDSLPTPEVSLLVVMGNLQVFKAAVKVVTRNMKALKF